MKIFITGVAGFIGFHLAQRLLKENHQVFGVDNLNSYYSVDLKKSRLTILKQFPNFNFAQIDISESPALEDFFQNFDCVVHLAAEAGVRNSHNPWRYIKTNLLGFSQVLEQARLQSVSHFIFASTSAVYGNNPEFPFTENQITDQPISVYAATKKSNELLAHSYAHLYQMPCTGLRFFTVYGPWGRPDMAYFKFSENIVAERPIDIYHEGQMQRDLTYIDDVIEALNRIIHQGPKNHFSIYNIGRGEPIYLMDLISQLEKNLNKKAIKNYLPLQPGDVLKTYAGTSRLKKDYGFEPKVSLEEGLKKFADWFLAH